MKTRRILREYIRLVLEAAVNAAAAANDGLALYVIDDRKYVLYDVETLRQQIEDDPSLKKRPSNDLIVGMLFTYKYDSSEYGGASEVNKVAARKGYGPLMYDIAMSNSEHGLFADRSGTSEDAKKIWRYYATKRSDVTAKPFKGFFMSVDDDLLDRVYSTKSPVDFSALTKAHERAMREAAAAAPRESVEKMLETAAENYFARNYSSSFS